MKRTELEMRRFARVRLEELGGNLSELAREVKKKLEHIREPGEPERKIERRVLRMLSDRNVSEEDLGKVRMSLRQIEWFHLYMKECGHPGLTAVPFFARDENLFDSFKPRGPVTFVLGSRPVSHTLDGHFSQSISTNDVRAVSSFFPVPPLRDRKMQLRDLVATENTTPEMSISEVDRALADTNASAVIAIGSALSNRGSEVVVCQMVGVHPFTPMSPDRQLPFRFVYDNDVRAAPPPSALCISLEQARAMVRDDLRDEFDGFRPDIDRATIIGTDTVLISQDERKEAGFAYGVLMAQRRTNQDVALCIWGSSSPATLRLAELTADPGVSKRLPAYDSNLGRQPILVAVVEVEVAIEPDDTGHRDPRNIVGSRFIGGPRMFYPEGDNWVERA